ncbi:MAG: cytochrome c3 family protein, partial [Methanosarcinales archaeon]|nr:cytochrome c3 family protein [Methanosarcinales archaeon]
DGSSIPSSSHPTGYLTPKNCTLCHINGDSATNFTAPQVSEHYAGGTELQTTSYANINDSCVGCHIENEMLESFNDDTGTQYSNVSHYGKSRNNTILVSGGVVNCQYCHDNATSTTFEFVDTTNRTISNHSTNYPATNPDCTDCHNQGRLHDGSLAIPTLNDALCMGCHTDRQEHNSAVLCINCHVNNSESRNKTHPIQYIDAFGLFDTYNTTAVNCEDCHQGAGVSGFETAMIVAQPVNHSSDNAGQKWGNYWGVSVGSSNNTNVAEESITTGTTSGIANAQTEDSSFETMDEANVGGAPVDNYYYVSSNTQTTGTITSFANMQNGADGGAFATLTEAGSGGGAPGTSNATANAIGAGDTSGDILADLQADDASGAPPVTTTGGDGKYSVDKALIMFIDGFDTSGMSGTVSAATLWVQYSVEGGYNGNNPIQWALDGGALSSTGIVPVDPETDVISSYNLYAQGVDTLSEISTLDIEFTNNDASGPDAVSFDYVWLEVTYSGGSSTYAMNITADTASVPAADTHYLEMNYRVDAGDNYDVYVYDGAWNNRGTLSSTSWAPFNYTLTTNEYNSGTPSVRFIDQNPSGATQGNLDIDYLRIHSVTAGGTNYRLDILQNVTGIPVEDNYILTVKGKTDGGESYDVQVYDSGWVTES